MNNDIKRNDAFIKQGFFKSSDGINHTGLSIIGTLLTETDEDKNEINSPVLGFYYINSGLNKSEEITNRPVALLKEKNLEKLKLVIQGIIDGKLKKGDFSTKINKNMFLTNQSENGGNDFYVKILNKGLEFEYGVSEGDLLELNNIVDYSLSYMKNEVKNIKLNKLSTEFNLGVNNFIQENKNEIDFNKEIYKANLIRSAEGIKLIDIPTIEESFHGYNTASREKVAYYFKFFPNYLNSFRKQNNGEKNNVSGSNYPFQVIVHQGGQSEVMTLTEKEFIIMTDFLKNTKDYLDGGATLTAREGIKKGLIVSEGGKSIELTNTYNGKTFKNQDVVSDEIFETLKRLQEDDNQDEILKFLTGLKNEGILKKNKFINKEMCKGLKLSQNNFLNFKVSRSKEGEIDNSAGILQIGKKIGNDSLTFNVIKGDLKKGGIKFLTAPVADEKYFSFLGKTDIINNYLINPSLEKLDLINKNIQTINYLGKKEGFDIVSKYITFENNQLLKSLTKAPLVELLGESNFPIFDKKQNIELSGEIDESTNFNFRLFIGNGDKLFNKTVFSLKKDIPELINNRYPFSFSISAKDQKEKICNFSLNIGESLRMNKALSNGKPFILRGKATDKSKELIISKVGEKLNIKYSEGTDIKGPFHLKNEYNLNPDKFLKILKKNVELVTYSPELILSKSINYNNTSIYFKNKELDNIKKETEKPLSI